MSISLRSNADGSGTLLNGSTPVMEITAAGVVSLPNIAAGSSANQPVNLGQVLGVGQTWQNVTAGRALGVTYTNSTGKPIFVKISGYGTTGADLRITINGLVTMYQNVFNVSATSGTVYGLVPNGSTYSASIGAGSLQSMDWAELR